MGAILLKGGFIEAPTCTFNQETLLKEYTKNHFFKAVHDQTETSMKTYPIPYVLSCGNAGIFALAYLLRIIQSFTSFFPISFAFVFVLVLVLIF
jgi:hypothetical protein